MPSMWNGERLLTTLCVPSILMSRHTTEATSNREGSQIKNNGTKDRKESIHHERVTQSHDHEGKFSGRECPAGHMTGQPSKIPRETADVQRDIREGCSLVEEKGRSRRSTSTRRFTYIGVTCHPEMILCHMCGLR